MQDMKIGFAIILKILAVHKRLISSVPTVSPREMLEKRLPELQETADNRRNFMLVQILIYPRHAGDKFNNWTPVHDAGAVHGLPPVEADRFTLSGRHVHALSPPWR